MKELPSPGEAEAIERVAAATRLLVSRSKDRFGNGHRDVHPKHHGCVLGRLKVRPDLPSDLRHGLLAPGAEYRAWIRFSNSSKNPQSDAIPDGRGIAIKLLDVPGERLEGDAARGEQDLVLLNYPAFFARDAAEMAEVAEREVQDAFPGSFFVRLDRARGLRAFLGAAAKDVTTPLSLQYFSQTPYRLGPHVVKLRLAPTSDRSFSPSAAQLRSGNHLFHALRAQLAPPPTPEERAAGPAGQPFRRALPSFELSVQRPVSELDAVEDATVVWRGEFTPVAQLELLLQHVGGDEQWSLASRIAFNPWNGLRAHEPLGSINRVRRCAYEASRRTRQTDGQRPDLSIAHWEKERGLRSVPGDLGWSPPAPPPDRKRAVIALRALFPELVQRLARHTPALAYGLSAALFALIVYVGHAQPGRILSPLAFGLGPMPSEKLIPGLRISERGRALLDARGLPRQPNPNFRFRYEPTGSELHGGLPYWVYRTLPRLFPQQFHGRDDWSRFGLYPDDDDTFYSSYHDLPRGLVLSDTRVSLGGNQLDVKLKRVSFNCASCHRGEVEVAGKRHYIDGMPNVGIDTAAYKRVVFELLGSPAFTANRLIEEIDRALAEAHPKGAGPPPRLTPYERFVYRAIVQASKLQAQKKPLTWMDRRPLNGVGRLDAFGALRFEFMTDYDPVLDRSIATVDLPSIWNQGADVRSWHHWDGNTNDVRARNFGAIVGVGAAEPSIRRETVEQVGSWIDRLPSPRFEALTGERLDPSLARAGRVLYQTNCETCHGEYDERGALSGERPACMEGPVADVGTDPERARAVDPAFVERLNTFGENQGLWGATAFRSSGGKYLCPPLDGIWARAPYLHNGSVPTLDALLTPPEQRPKAFWRGNPAYDPARGGFRTDPPDPPSHRAAFYFDTSLAGNGNQGHAFPLRTPDERKQLIAYLLTL